MKKVFLREADFERRMPHAVPHQSVPFSSTIPPHPLALPQVTIAIREAVYIKEVAKLWTFSVPPLARPRPRPLPPHIYEHLGGCFIVKLVVLSYI